MQATIVREAGKRPFSSAIRLAGVVLSAVVLFTVAGPAAAQPAAPVTITDYDENDWYLVRGQERLSYHGMREGWVYNRAMVWLDKNCGVDGGILCYSSQSPLPLTGKRQVSRWYAGSDNEVVDVDDRFHAADEEERQVGLGPRLPAALAV